MLTQMFSKLFRTTSKSTSSQQLPTNASFNSKMNSSASSSKLSSTAFNNASMYDRPPIYSVSTISSCFQQQSNDEITPNLLGLDFAAASPSLSSRPTETMSASSISPSSSTSSSSAAASHGSIACDSSSRFSFGFDGNNSIKRQLDKKQSITSTMSTSSATSGKLDSNSIKQIYIAPHCIRYTNSTLDDTVYRIDEDSLNEIAREILESDNTPPKLQIVYYNSQYFAINNSHLQVYKQLQMCGLITHVQADVLSVETIPYALRQHLLQTPYDLAHHNGSGSTVNSNDDDDDGEEDATDEDDSLQRASEESYGNPSYPANHMIDILSAEHLNMLEKEMLVDETYEFGACENCVESDDGEDHDEHRARRAKENNASLFHKRRNLLNKSNRSAKPRHLSNLSEVNEEEFYENERDGLSRRRDYYSPENDDEEEEEVDEESGDDEEVEDEDDDDDDEGSNVKDEDACSFYDDEEEADEYTERIFKKEPRPMISSISQQVNNFKLSLPKKAIERLNAKKTVKSPIKSATIIEKLQAQNDWTNREENETKKESVNNGENEKDEEENEDLTLVKTIDSKSYVAVDNPQPAPLPSKLATKTRRLEQLKCESSAQESENLISSN